MALQLIDLNEDIEYINIDASKVPYSFSIKLTDKTFSFTVKYNDTGGFYTIDLLEQTGMSSCSVKSSATPASCSTWWRTSGSRYQSSSPCALRETAFRKSRKRTSGKT